MATKEQLLQAASDIYCMEAGVTWFNNPVYPDVRNSPLQYWGSQDNTIVLVDVVFDTNDTPKRILGAKFVVTGERGDEMYIRAGEMKTKDPNLKIISDELAYENHFVTDFFLKPFIDYTDNHDHSLCQKTQEQNAIFDGQAQGTQLIPSERPYHTSYEKSFISHSRLADHIRRIKRALRRT